MNRHCPACGYPIRPAKHAAIGLVAFCRTSCVIAWMAEHGLTLARKHVDDLPEGIDRRVAS